MTAVDVSADPHLLTIPRAAARSGLTRTRIYEKIRSGELVSLKVDGRRFVPRDELDRYVAGLIDAARAEVGDQHSRVSA